MAYNTDTTGNAATSTKLQTARTINGIATFDGSAAITTNNTGWMPSDYGWLAWNGDLATAPSNAQIVGGTLYMVAIKIPAATTITNVIINIAAQGTSLTANQCFAGLYQGGTLLASTADQSGVWNSAGTKVMALSAAQSVSAGTVYVAICANGTGTFPAPSRFGALNFNGTLSAPNLRFASGTGGTTSLPSSMPTQSSSLYSIWAAVS